MASIVSAGTTSATALNMSADTTGILQLASNNGTVALTITTAQNVGIGTATPVSNGGYGGLTLNGTSGAILSLTQAGTEYLRLFGASSGGSIQYASSAPLTFVSGVSGGTTYMTLDNSGNLVVGSVGASGSTVIKALSSVASGGTNITAHNFNDTGGGVTYAGINFVVGSDSGTCAIRSIRTNAGTNFESALQFLTNPAGATTTPTEKVRVPSGGGIRIAMQNYSSDPSSTNYGVSLNNTGAGSRFFGQGTGTETQIEFGNTNGTRGSIQTNATVTLYNTTSDYRLKENVVPMANALATVLALKPCTYKWKVDGSDGQGFIAHELQAVVPDCVSGEKDAVDEEGNIKPQFVDTSFLVATLTAAIQELNAKVTALENK